jgi:cob(I)alamin adenosyltransferase
MKIYTKTGDDGSTGLLGPGRVGKDHPRIEAYGSVDELNATLGLARAVKLNPRLDVQLAAVQDDLFAVGSALADPDPAGPFHEAVSVSRFERLETEIDAMEAELPPLTRFILPGGSLASAQIHLARATCRRAERLVISLAHVPGEHVPEPLIIYLNRLSDYLFVMARLANQLEGMADVVWSGL